MDKLILTCPVRGVLKASGKSADGLTPSEEALRVETIRHLVREGYPKENFKIEPIIKKFGSAGRNSFRADFAVLNVPASVVNVSDVDTLLSHSIVLCEVKRDNAGYDYVKHTQVKPLLDFAKLDRCVALYWDNISHRIFWQEWVEGKRIQHEGSLSLLPKFGDKVNVTYLTIGDLERSDSLIGLFERIEDILHQASIDPDKRYEIILQLILAKLFDEHSNDKNPKNPLRVQDFALLGTPVELSKQKMNELLGEAIAFYQCYLPRKVSNVFNLRSQTLVDILTLLAPIRLTAAKREVIQTFYMKFAKDLYKWDLAQYFTPITVTDFIIDVLNPQFGEHLKDPACGSADFLTAAFHKCRDKYQSYSDCVWGSDNSPNAVQIAIINMLLNGDGKTNIRHEDSLEASHQYENQYNIVVCNPPFGSKILEKRKEILARFDLGHEWVEDPQGRLAISTQILDKQETGILFVEVCVVQTKPNGRIGLVLPNGYLGNRSKKYHILREWLLRHCKLVSVCSFPRFTFKSSGADVSASVVFLQKREKVLESARADDSYQFNAEIIETVGWNVGNKRGELIYRRNPSDGSYLIGEEGGKIPDSDFDKILRDMRNSIVSFDYPWLMDNTNEPKNGWSVPIKTVFEDQTITIDPKIYSKKFLTLRDSIMKVEHFLIGDILDLIPESTTKDGKRVRKKSSQLYDYVEISDIGYGEFRSRELRGWQLPSRAKHFAESGDIYIGAVWGSVEKWCIIGDDSKHYVVTNGCHRLRIKKGQEEALIDLVAYLSTDSFATQMRAMARGSDGLAEVPIDAVLQVLVPKIIDENTRNVLRPYVNNLLAGRQSLHATVSSLITHGQLNIPMPARRPNHTVLV